MKKITLAFILMIQTCLLAAQDSTGQQQADPTGAVITQTTYDPHLQKIIPDKVFEFGVPFLLIFLLLNTIVTVMKNRAEHQLKLRMIEKGVSEETLIKIFGQAGNLAALQFLKWFLFMAATGIALLVIHFLKTYLTNQSGYLAIGIILLLNAVAFIMYYNILTRKK